jgi:putative colanic acid biosynthesis glycosyltransferase
LIHLHNLHGYWINSRDILVGIAELGIPIVWTLHDYWPITGHCAYFEQVGCVKWRVGCQDCPQIRRYPKSFMDRSEKNYFEKRSVYNELSNLHIVAVSKHSEKLIGNSILAQFPLTTIYNSIDTKIFRPVAPAMKFEGQTVIGCVAKVWDERKGLDDILKVRDVLGESFVLLVVGLAKNQIRYLPPGIIGIPPTNSAEELAALYSSMDVFFNPSSEETFGLTTLEAMACGVPAVIYDVSASREIQPKFMDRGIVELRHYGDVVAAIEEITNVVTPALKESLVRYVAEKFSRDTFLSDYYALYSRLIKARQN